ncbi:autotransporter domain-containing protein [Methylomonas montana]|uniref:autotransporter domain-containing protein n=1 Tax=Methylomonas montana TaxID=3058963 RepID=UPI002657B1AA|nr:autotransporter domain-containing protein [Methylomonas montana]WKJ91421.1 autotransporter domain-containing protein [Methylomonas montana]
MSLKLSFRQVDNLMAGAGLILAATVTPSSAELSYQITDLSPLSGNPSAHAQSINDSGQIVGFSDTFEPPASAASNNTKNTRNAVIWTWHSGSSTASPLDLGTIALGADHPNFNSTSVIKINNQGQVLGNAIDLTTNQLHAVLWREGTFARNSLTVFGNDQTNGAGIVNIGQVVGTNLTTNQAFIWRQDPVSGQQTVSYLAGSGSGGVAINNANQVLLTVGQDVYLLPNTNPIPALSGTWPTALNDRGQVVFINDGDAFVRLPDGSLVSLAGGEAYALNNDGQVVGQRNEGNTAIVWYPTANGGWSQAFDLNDLAVFSSSPFNLNQAFGINNLGQIVGEASIDGNIHGFLATPTGTLSWDPTTSSRDWDSAANWDSGFGFTPNALFPTVIRPNANAITVDGPALDATVNNLVLGGGSGAATLNLHTGSLTAVNQLTVHNNATLNFSAVRLAANSILNQGTVNISGAGTRTIAGAVTNEGIFKVTDTSVQYTGAFANNGAYISDPSTNQFNNLSVGSTGYLVGGTGDQFIVAGDFNNASNENMLWNTANADLIFSGLTGTHHTMGLASADQGITATVPANNFAWGSMTLNSGNFLKLVDGNTPPGAALYAGRIILADGLGQLSNINSDYNVYFDPTLAGNQYLLGSIRRFGTGGGQLLPWSLVPFGSEVTGDTALTPNQQNFGAALAEACTAPTGILATRCLQLQGLSPAQQRLAVASLTPDQVPGQMAGPIKFSATRMDSVFSRLANLRHGSGSAPLSINFNGLQMSADQLARAFGVNGIGGAAGDDNELFRDNPLGFFVQTRFNFGDQRTSSWDRGFNSQAYTATVGADYRVNDRLVTGLAFNYAGSSAQYDESAGHMDSDTYMGAFYGSYFLPEDFYVDWMANYGSNEYSFNRQYGYAGFNGQSDAKPSGHQYSVALSSGKDLSWQGWTIGPYLRLEYLGMHIGEYREQGGNGFDVTTGAQTNHSFIGNLGAQISYAISTSWGVVTPALRAEWEHQYLNDNRAIAMRLSQAAPGLGNFAVQTGNPDRDYLNLGGSVSAVLANGGNGFIRYETRIGQSYISDHIVEVGIRMSF